MRSCNNNSNNNSSISGAGIIKCFNFCVQATAHTWPRPKRLSGFLSFGAFFRSQVWQHFNPRGVTRNGYGCARVLPSWRLHLRGDTRFSQKTPDLSQSWNRQGWWSQTEFCLPPAEFWLINDNENGNVNNDGNLFKLSLSKNFQVQLRHVFQVWQWAMKSKRRNLWACDKPLVQSTPSARKLVRPRLAHPAVNEFYHLNAQNPIHATLTHHARRRRL